MLLVHHRDREGGELDRLLDQRVGADDELGLTRREGVEQLAPLGAGGRRGEERCRHRFRFEERLQRAEVLLRERLGRRHQRRLMSGLDRAQHREDADHRLAAAHLPHQQPLHRLCAGEILVDLLDGPPLVTGQLERQRRQPVSDTRTALGERDPAVTRDTAAAPGDQRRLVEKELLEGEALPRRLGGVLVRREVRGGQRVLGTRQPQLPAQATGNRLDRVARLRDRLPGPLANALRAQALARRVNGNDSGGVEARLR